MSFAVLGRILQFLGLARPARETPSPASGTSSPSDVPEPKAGSGPSMSSQAVLAMPELVAIGGTFPIRGEGEGSGSFTMAMIQVFAGSIPAFGAPRAEGQMMAINPDNQRLFSLLGTSYGGDGVTTFGLPNLNQRVAIGGSRVGEIGKQTLTMTFMIASDASPMAPLPGMVALFAPGWAPTGWLVADGRMLSIEENMALFQIIGTIYGGDGEKYFALPNLDGAAAVGAGQGGVCRR